jgi:hypothetical protein
LIWKIQVVKTKKIGIRMKKLEVRKNIDNNSKREKIQETICIICQELRGDLIDDTEKADISDDFSGLLNQKKEFSFVLGFNIF